MVNSDKFYIPILLGTSRQGRQSEKVSKFIFEKLRNHSQVESRYFDVRDMDDINANFPDEMEKADALIIVTPEYNRGYPGDLKNVLDFSGAKYTNKPISLVGVSSGPFGAVRVIERLLPTLRTLGAFPHSHDLNFSNINDVFDESGDLLEDVYHERTDKFIEETLKVAKFFKAGRNSL